MKLLKQPWFIIFLVVISVYTYRFYQNPRSLEFSLNTAEATNTSDKKQDAKGDSREKMQVNIVESFKLEEVKSFYLSTYYKMDIRFEKSNDEKITVLLKGSGTRYKNDGSKLGDWFDLKVSHGDFKMTTPESHSLSFKKLFQRGFSDDQGQFELIVQVPEKHQFATVKVEAVSSNLIASNIRFENFKSESVSGDVKMVQCSGDTVKVESVSGNSDIDVAQLKTGEFESVSGSTLLKSRSEVSQVTFESVSGDLKLEMPKETNLDVHFESLSGELSNEFGLSKKPLSSLKFSSLSGSAKVSKIK